MLVPTAAPAPAATPVLHAPPCAHDDYETVITLDVLDRWIADAREARRRRRARWCG